MNYLAIDYGLKHIGLATASTSLAEPLQTIPTNQAFEIIPSIIREQKIDHIIIGFPDGSVSESVKKFALDLGGLVSIPITPHDETLSSHDAKENLKTSKKSKRSGPDHHYAAALILQDYLDFNT